MRDAFPVVKCHGRARAERTRPTREEIRMSASRTRTVLAALGLAAATGITGGCASTSDIDAIRALAEEAKADAAQAQRSADAAGSTADEALRKAESAQAEARDAGACCEQTNEKIDRMFKRSMYK